MTHVIDDEEPRYWTQELDNLLIVDLNFSIGKGDIIALVDEDEGGIIAYIIRDHEDRIVRSLTLTSEANDKIKEEIEADA